jgi:hypothetical protein
MYKRGTIILWQYFENYSCITVKMEVAGSSKTLQLSTKLHSVTSQKMKIILKFSELNIGQFNGHLLMISISRLYSIDDTMISERGAVGGMRTQPSSTLYTANPT